MCFLKRLTVVIQKKTVCITTSYIQQEIVIVFTMTFKCVLTAVKTYVQ
jgi:hypothetical protein